MRYAEARNQIKTGDLLAWSAQGDLRSRHGVETYLERIFQGDKFTHVGVAWVAHGRVFVMDLTTRGCAPRPLSGDLPCYWLPAPRELPPEALEFAFSRFGEMIYSRWQAVLGWLRRLRIGSDLLGQCAEYALEIYRVAGIATSAIATPSALVDGAQEVWGVPLYKITE